MNFSAPSLANIRLSQIGPAVKILIDALSHRGELATVELSEARDHAIKTFVAGFVASLLALLCGIASLFTLAALVWDNPHRGFILGSTSVVLLLGAGLLASLVVRRLAAWQPFDETRRQLHADQHCIRSILTSPTESH